MNKFFDKYESPIICSMFFSVHFVVVFQTFRLYSTFLFDSTARRGADGIMTDITDIIHALNGVAVAVKCCD